MHQWPRAGAGKSKTARGAKGAPEARSKHNQRKSEKEKPTKNHEKEGARWGNHRRGRRVGRGEGCTHHIRIAKVQLSGA